MKRWGRAEDTQRAEAREQSLLSARQVQCGQISRQGILERLKGFFFFFCCPVQHVGS